MRRCSASFYHSLTILASAVVFFAGMVLISYGIGYALVAVSLTVLGVTFAKKLEEEFYVEKAKEDGRDE